MNRLGLAQASYIGADSEMVQWTDDGGPTIDFTSPADARPEVLARLTAQAEQIDRLMCRINQLERERDYWVNKLANLDAPRETPAFPLNAIKHSL